MPEVIAVMKDIFFAAKIRETAKHKGIDTAIVRSYEDMFDFLNRRTKLLIFDLREGFDFTIVKDIKGNRLFSDIGLIGFLPHVNTELKNEALSAGFDRVYSRGEFSKKLAEII